MFKCKLLLSAFKGIIVQPESISKSFTWSRRCNSTLMNRIHRCTSNNNLNGIINQVAVLDNHQNTSKLYSEINLVSKRYKVSRSGRKKPTDKDDEESDDEDEAASGENPLLMEENNDDGTAPIVIHVNSLRIDSVAKVAFAKSRGKIEEHFYKGELLVNGEVPPKKSLNINAGDELDLILGANSEDPTLVDIKRAQILNLPDKADNLGHMNIKIILEQLTVKL